MRPQKPKDLFVTNGWYAEMPGLISPSFQTLAGLGVASNSVTTVDAGTNIKYKFASQILDYKELTLTRCYDGSSDDSVLDGLVDACMQEGVKIDVVFVKLHNKKEVFRMAIIGFRFVTREFPTWDIQGEDRFDVSYTATMDYSFKL